MSQPKLNPTQKFDLVIRSAILRGEKPTKGIEATLAANENQMNRVVAYLDGQKVVVAQRHGKGGMDFNKLLGGKVFAVAADGLSPVFVKGPDKKPTREQKLEDGLPLFSSSGFYLLSSKEYPAVMMAEAFTRVFDKGEKVMLVSSEQLAARQRFELESEMDWELMLAALQEQLDDSHNYVAALDADMNKKRRRGIDSAKTQAEDDDEKYEGVDFAELAVSKKDGNAFVLFSFQVEGETPRSGSLMREYEGMDDQDRPTTVYEDAETSAQRFAAGADARHILAALEAGKKVSFAFVQGHVMRTSVSFRRKAENVLAAPSDKAQYGDAVYILAALNGWVKGIVSVMHSMHPNFPTKDYDAHHYVVACRQAEVGMMKREGGWQPPKALAYELEKAVL
ncbi:hypothetical protein D3C71_22020 [compost metagenome]